MTEYPSIFNALAVPFGAGEVKVRQAPGGRQLSYITARTAMNRLDAVLGPENWADDYTPLENSVVCRLTIVLPDGKAITKSDAGGYAGMADQGDDDKSGFSDAFKRACAKFGVGRHLYNDGFMQFDDAGHGVLVGVGEAPAPARQQAPQRSAPPSRPAGRQQAPRREEGDGGQGIDWPPWGQYGAPRTGKHVWGYAKEHELVGPVNSLGKRLGLPARMVDWDESDTAAIVAAINHARSGEPATVPDDGDDHPAY